MLYQESDMRSEKLQKAIERNRRKKEKEAALQNNRFFSSAPTIVADYRPLSTTFIGRLREFLYSSRKKARTVPRKGKTAGSERSGEGARLFVRAYFVLLLFLFLRLFFSAGGIRDYLAKEKDLENANLGLRLVERENQEIREEMNAIKKSSSLQKKIVRDHLGFIAKDEFLILFSQGQRQGQGQRQEQQDQAIKASVKSKGPYSFLASKF